MTPNHDIDRVLDQWFAEGPTQMPSRFMADTLDRIDREPRRHVGLRPTSMRSNTRRAIAAAAVVVLLVAAIGAVAFLHGPAVGDKPSASPSALLPGSWSSVGTRHRPYQNGDHIVDTVNRVDIVIGAADVHWTDFKADIVNSRSLVGPDMLELKIAAAPPPEWKCQVGDVGTYGFVVSPDGQRLTLNPIGDVCAVRQAILAGDWQRTDIGELAPGRHAARLFKPFDDAGDQFSYTVPTGWSDQNECSVCYVLMQSSATATSSIELISRVAPSSGSTACASSVAGVRDSPNDIASWLTNLPGLDVTQPTAVTIGGLEGVMVDVSTRRDTPLDSCRFLVDGSGDLTLDAPGLPDRNLSVSSTGISRWMLLDRGDGSTLLVNLETQERATWAAQLAAAMPVVETFEFAAPTSAPVPSAPAAIDVAMLQAKWTSVTPRDWPGTTTASSPFAMVIDPTTMVIANFKGDVASSVTFTEPDRLDLLLQSTAAYWECQVGQKGTYSVGLSANGRTLTLTPASDACATRARLLTGDWTRWPCPNPDSTCQAELGPGRHVSDFRTPDGFVTTLIKDFSYIVPAGWSQLQNQMALGRQNDPDSMTISLTLDVAPHSQASDCPDTPEPGVGTTAAAMADWLTRVPGLVATTPAPITIDGYRGLQIDVSVSPTEALACQFTNEPRTVFTFTDQAPAIDDTLDSATIRDLLEGDAHSRYILLDLWAGHNVLIEVSAPDKTSWDGFMPAAMPVVDNLAFDR